MRLRDGRPGTCPPTQVIVSTREVARKELEECCGSSALSATPWGASLEDL